MNDLLQTVISVMLAGLLAGQIVITRTGRLRRSIRADVQLLNSLPADHPSRAMVTAHSEKLVDKLIQRERRQFEPIAAARVSFSATQSIAAMMLIGVYAVVTHATGVDVWEYGLKWLDRQDPWEGMAYYAAVGIICASFSLWFWRQRQREHPKVTPAKAQPLTGSDISVAAPEGSA
jgi:hypothetical protein